MLGPDLLTFMIAQSASAAVSRIIEQVMRDPLTGMHNRRYLDEALPAEIARAIRERDSLSLMPSLM